MNPAFDPRQQLRLFVLAALVVAGVLLALTVFGRPPQAEPPPGPDARRGLEPRQPRQPRQPRPQGRDRAASARSSAPSARGEVIAVARRFTTAFIAYQDGRCDGQVRDALRASAAPGLRRALLAGPVRLPARRRPRRSRLAALQALEITPTAAYVLASLRQRGRRRQLVITLRRRGRSFAAIAVR